eukprot:TRINITY_DN54253_c0_g1_i2.p1 TRINITY_DN54253_c0_g1~~TRINITY_DN54253_c0_g1_i2.p1  ORF type:complete len:918 (-),score=210.27 TRINITY_DN54253_c0_g1_i2:211-2964(-)
MSRRLCSNVVRWLEEVLRVLVLAMVVAEAVVPLNTPFQVVRPSPNHSALMPVAEGIAQLAEHEGNIALLSVVGPYHSGKSFLLNAIAGDMSTFSVGRKTSPETMGIWLCRTNMTAKDGSEVWLMDSEGFFGPGVDEGYDAKVFTLAALLGGHVVYNTVKVIDQQAVSMLEMLVQRAQLFRARSAVSATSEVPDFLHVDAFPPLTWVVEDFVQELPSRLRDEGATGWLRTYLEETSGRTDGVTGEGARRSDFLSSLFRDVRVHTLFLPATSREQLRDLSRLSWGELTQEFREEVTDLRKHVVEGLAARTFRGRSTNGQALAKALRFIIQGLQKGMLHELPSLWQSWARQVEEVSLADADAWFESLAATFAAATGENDEALAPLGVVSQRVEEARERVTAYYRTLIRDFNTAPRIGELRRRMDAHLQAALVGYHERVRQWVNARILETKERFVNELAQKSLPAEPTSFERDSEALRQKAAGAFAATLEAFAAPPKGSRLAQGVAMPNFGHDPATLLAADLRAQLAVRTLENERAAQQLFKAAVAAADTAVGRALNATGGRLLGKAQLNEIRTKAEQVGWQVFEAQLQPHAWAKRCTLYKPHAALMREEHLKGRVARFAAANEQRLAQHFAAATQRILATYSANRSQVPLPTTEADVDLAHSQLAASATDSLESFAGNLSDTGAFSEARKRLKEALEEGLRQVRDKNVELWKVHSDEATACAQRSNRDAEKRCSWLFCFFTTIPWYHKYVSRKHLRTCFSQSLMGARMTPSLQSHVFDIWYKKDLGYEAGRVSTRFWLLVAAISALAGGAWFLRWRRRRAWYYYYAQGGYYPSGQPVPPSYAYYGADLQYRPEDAVGWQQAYGSAAYAANMPYAAAPVAASSYAGAPGAYEVAGNTYPNKAYYPQAGVVRNRYGYCRGGG